MKKIRVQFPHNVLLEMGDEFLKKRYAKHHIKKHELGNDAVWKPFGMEELPECPVCLQSYDDGNAIPRVLSCGHTVCEACLVELPQRYPNTLRCPACTQLVKYPKQGPSSLPKNIDLLRLCLQHQQHSSPSPSHRNRSRKPNQRSSINDGNFLRFCSDEFYATWKDWILPDDAVSVVDEHERGLVRFGFGSGSSSRKGRVCFGVNRTVRLSLVPIVSFSNSNSKFRFSYVARVIKCLEGMDEVSREGLALVLEASVRQGSRRVCRVYGLWSEDEVVDGPLYLVCERNRCRVFDECGELRNGDGLELDNNNNNNKGGVCGGFAVIGKGICESVLALHLEGLVIGCLGLSCFCFDELGAVCIDLNEVIVMGRKVVDAVSGGAGGDKCGDELKDCLESELFISPELLSKLLHKGAIDPESGHSTYPIGFGSDVWSLACVLLRLLLGNALPRNTLEVSEENGIDVLASYISWVEKVSSVLEDKIGSEYPSLGKTLCKCLDIDPGCRPDVVDIRKCIQDVLVKHQFGFLGNLEVTINRNNAGHHVIIADLCQLPEEISKELKEHELQVKGDGGQPDFLHDGEGKSDEDFVAGLSKGMTEFQDLQGHLDCITGLAVGGMNPVLIFKQRNLYQSYFDDTICCMSG